MRVDASMLSISFTASSPAVSLDPDHVARAGVITAAREIEVSQHRTMLSVVLASAAWAPQPVLDRRAVFGGVAAALLSARPLPAVARSKQKAAEMALQKETAKEARQAMKEYKCARFERE